MGLQAQPEGCEAAHQASEAVPRLSLLGRSRRGRRVKEGHEVLLEVGEYMLGCEEPGGVRRWMPEGRGRHGGKSSCTIEGSTEEAAERQERGRIH